MSEILPDEHQPPIYKTGEGNPLHQTVYGQTPVESQTPHEPEPLPEHLDLTTPDVLPVQVEHTEPQNPTLETVKNDTPPQPETDVSPELDDSDIEELVSVFEKLETAFRAASEADKTLGDQIRIAVSKIQDRLRSSNPNEAGFAPIKRSVDTLTASLTQNPFYKSLVDGDGNHIPIPSFKDELQQTLSRLRDSEDRTERSRLIGEAETLVKNQIAKAEELANKQKANEAQKKAILAIITQAEREAVEKERQIIQVVNDGQPLPPESISAIYSTLARELATQARAGISTGSNSELLATLGNSVIEKLTSITNRKSGNAETNSTPQGPTSESEKSTETNNGEISAVQKEVIDRAFSDPDSRDRLKTVIETFGTKAVREYFQSKIESSTPTLET